MAAYSQFMNGMPFIQTPSGYFLTPMGFVAGGPYSAAFTAGGGIVPAVAAVHGNTAAALAAGEPHTPNAAGSDANLNDERRPWTKAEDDKVSKMRLCGFLVCCSLWRF
jgi:hypothetical protein